MQTTDLLTSYHNFENTTFINPLLPKLFCFTLHREGGGYLERRGYTKDIPINVLPCAELKDAVA